jgi:hypothetical protein
MPAQEQAKETNAVNTFWTDSSGKQNAPLCQFCRQRSLTFVIKDVNDVSI